MENLSPITVVNDIPTKKYVDDNSKQGFSAYTGRYAPAWGSAESLTQFYITPNWIYAYRIVNKVSIRTIAVEIITPYAGGTGRILVYSDAYPWPGTQLQSSAFTTDTAGFRYAELTIAPGSYWLAIHGISAISLRSVVGVNPFSPGALNSGGAETFASGVAYNTGGTTSPTTWPVGSEIDVGSIALLLRAS